MKGVCAIIWALVWVVVQISVGVFSAKRPTDEAQRDLAGLMPFVVRGLLGFVLGDGSSSCCFPCTSPQRIANALGLVNTNK